MATVAGLKGFSVPGEVTDLNYMVIGSGRVGIELELENIHTQMRVAGWECTIDNSLRNGGLEYVLRGAQGGNQLYTSILALEDALSTLPFDANLRCSTHIHLDVRTLQISQLKKLLLAYLTFEGLFFASSGDYRKSNNFCPAFSFAQFKLKQLARIWTQDEETFLNQMCDWGSSDGRTNDKYSSLNLVPVHTQGSVEFRGSEPKPSAGQMLRLANRMLGLYDLVVQTPLEVSDAEFISNLSSGEIPEQVLMTLPREVPFNSRELIEEGSILAYDVISGI